MLFSGKMVLTGADKVDMKVVLLGKEFGGKTSLVERYLRNYFTGNVPYQAVIGCFHALLWFRSDSTTKFYPICHITILLQPVALPVEHRPWSASRCSSSFRVYPFSLISLSGNLFHVVCSLPLLFLGCSMSTLPLTLLIDDIVTNWITAKLIRINDQGLCFWALSLFKSLSWDPVFKVLVLGCLGLDVYATLRADIGNFCHHLCYI